MKSLHRLSLCHSVLTGLKGKKSLIIFELKKQHFKQHELSLCSISLDYVELKIDFLKRKYRKLKPLHLEIVHLTNINSLFDACNFIHAIKTN